MIMIIMKVAGKMNALINIGKVDQVGESGEIVAGEIAILRIGAMKLKNGRIHGGVVERIIRMMVIPGGIIKEIGGHKRTNVMIGMVALVGRRTKMEDVIGGTVLMKMVTLCMKKIVGIMAVEMMRMIVKIIIRRMENGSLHNAGEITGTCIKINSIILIQNGVMIM